MPLYLQKEREMINRMLKEIFAYIGMEEKKRTKEKKRLFWVSLHLRLNYPQNKVHLKKCNVKYITIF